MADALVERTYAKDEFFPLVPVETRVFFRNPVTGKLTEAYIERLNLDPVDSDPLDPIYDGETYDGIPLMRFDRFYQLSHEPIKVEPIWMIQDTVQTTVAHAAGAKFVNRKVWRRRYVN